MSIYLLRCNLVEDETLIRSGLNRMIVVLHSPEVAMFILKSLDGLTELARCETPREAMEKADALWIGSGGNVKISDGEGRDYSPDQFRSVYDTQNGPTTSGRDHHGEPRQVADKPYIDLPGG